MRLDGGGRAVRGLLVSLAVLLAAGVVAATSAGDPGPTVIAAGDRAGAASVGLDGLPDEPATEPAPATTPTVVATTSTRTADTSTSVRPRTTTTPPPATATTRPADPTSTVPTTTTLATVPLQSTWSASDGQLAVSVRMEPAALAGRPVTFTVTVSPGVGCCLGSTIAFGDEDVTVQTDPVHHALFAEQACAGRGPRSVTRTHTYAESAAYRAVVRVIGLECLPVPDENGVGTGKMVGVAIPMCIGVWPSDAARACAP
ncbi:MAG TPA: hypothetical protein VM388_04895 [Acidimicrobiales bacterium]|nr:hypothetical protein [Acidimicrobiales bacterium]